ncbi:MAG: hypothetical protein QOG16_1368 [Actinomycetota bacterium]|jgi:hypothetical protein|nr:hypothetical protein [Actinomycetota bacterium]
MSSRSRKALALAITAVLAATYSLVAVPQASAEEEREARQGSIIISKDTQFTDVNGVRGGSGTASDPYVISDWDVSEIRISDTDKHFLIKNNKVDFLTLNWNGNNVVVKNNEVGDLRVNENVPRTGGPTTGVIVNNTFDVVGQLRHWDGVFAHNVVGANPDAMDPNQLEIPFFGDTRAVNFDGWNGAHFYDNEIHGYVEVRLHGHHHSSEYGDSSHDHSATDEHAAHSMDDMDHTNRFHEVWLHDNTIYASGAYGLIYTDTNHAGNDRTANSEENEELNKPHQHHTKVHFINNKLIGAGIYVDIFNADDENHIKTNRGLMQIEGNDITLTYPEDDLTFGSGYDGITVWDAKDVDLNIINNSIRYDGSADPLAQDNEYSTARGISLRTLDKSDVTIGGNYIENFFYGIYASDMSNTVFWRVFDLETKGVSDQVAWDSNVKNEPQVDR